MPYSPRWLLSKGRRDEAEAVLDLLVDQKHVEERRELLSVSDGTFSRKGAFLDIWKPGARGRTTLGIFLNVAQQLAGM